MLYTPTTNNIEEMNRTDLVFEMAKKAHIDHYHHIIKMPTERIRDLLKFYNRPVEGLIFIGLDTASDEKDMTTWSVFERMRKMYSEGFRPLTTMPRHDGKTYMLGRLKKMIDDGELKISNGYTDLTNCLPKIK